MSAEDSPPFYLLEDAVANKELYFRQCDQIGLFGKIWATNFLILNFLSTNIWYHLGRFEKIGT